MDGLPTQELTISGREFKLTALEWRKGQPGLVKLMNLAGPALAKLLEGGVRTTKDGETEIADAKLGAAMADLFGRIRESDLDYFVSLFEPVTEVMQEHGFVRMTKLDPKARAVLFAADYGALMQWLRASIELNYASFLAGARDIARPSSAAAKA